MTSTFLKNKGRNFFDGKRARLLVKQRNIGGDEIEKGDEIEITGRNSECKNSLNIRSNTGIEINRVWCEQLELIK